MFFYKTYILYAIEYNITFGNISIVFDNYIVKIINPNIILIYKIFQMKSVLILRFYHHLTLISP